MKKENIFCFGGEVSGKSFLGRKRMVEKIAEEICPTSGVRNIAIVGLNKIGKSSLINRIRDLELVDKPDTIVIQTTVHASNRANEFWYRLVELIRLQLEKHGVDDAAIMESLEDIDTISIDDSRWFPRMSIRLEGIMRRLKELEYHVVLILDEFDYARTIFEREPGGLGLLRNLASQSDFSTKVITISRRRLYMIEHAINQSTSTLEHVFDTKFLGPFDDNDLGHYWDALTDYLIFPDDDTKKRLLTYAGYQPYLLCMYANRLVERKISGKSVDAFAVEQIHEVEYGGNITTYYQSLVERMTEDGYALKLRGILLSVMIDISDDDVKVFLGCGYLSRNDDRDYYILSEEFTKYFLDATKGQFPSDWDSVMSAERTLKNMIRTIYPKLDEFHYSELKNRSGWRTEICPDLDLSEEIVMDNMKNGPEYGKDPTIADVLSLKYIVYNIIKKNWVKFQTLFNNKTWNEWEPHLALLVRARTPLAHDHKDYLTETEINLLLQYCQQIIELGMSH